MSAGSRRAGWPSGVNEPSYTSHGYTATLTALVAASVLQTELAVERDVAQPVAGLDDLARKHRRSREVRDERVP